MQLMGVAEFSSGAHSRDPVAPPIPRASLSTVFAVSMIASNNVRCPSQSRHHLEMTKLGDDKTPVFDLKPTLEGVMTTDDITDRQATGSDLFALANAAVCCSS
jgi:hypothetical protein